MADVNMNEVLSKLDTLLGETDLSDVTSESTGYSDLPDGYYLTTVDKAELTVSKSSGNPMVAFMLGITGDGIDVEIEDTGNVLHRSIKGTNNRKIFKYYVFKDDTSIKRFVADMLKFEGEVEGEPLLPKEAFLNSETLEDALDCLIGCGIYVNVSTSEKDDGTKSTWTNLISWKRADALELPM